tara:strand:+ start:376 stop:1749 length:1374 start_codon:yes stop_codon:yes gene_type:complete
MAVITNNSIRPMGKNALRSVERQRQMASALQGQSMQPLRGQMAGRTYVGASPWQGAEKLAQMLAGTYVQGQADDRETQIEDDQRKAFMTDMNAYQDSIKGTPAVAGRPEVQAVDEIQGVREGGNKYDIFTGGNTNIPAVQHQDAIAGQEAIQAQAAIPGMSVQDAAMQQLNSKSDVMRKFAMDQLGKTQDPYTLSAGGVRYGANNQPLASNPKPIAPHKPQVLSPQGQLIGEDGKVIAENPNKAGGGVTVNMPVGETEFAKVIARKSADRMDDWINNGRSAIVQNDLKSLKFAVDILEKNPEATGFWASMTPDALKPYTNPEGVAAKESVEQVIQKSLKPILGGQFGEKEGDRLIARGYNIALEPEENIRRIRMLMTQTKLMADAQDAAVKWQMEHGNMRKYTGKIYTPADFDSAFDQLEKDYENKENTGNRNVVTDAETVRTDRLNQIRDRLTNRR